MGVVSSTVIVGEILHGEKPAIGLGRGDHALGDIAFVEDVGALFLDLAQGGGQLLLHQLLALLIGLAMIEEDGRDIGLFGEIFRAPMQQIHIALFQGDAVLGQLDGGLDQLGAAHGAIFGAQLLEAHHAARHAHRLVAEQAEIGDHIALGVQIHVLAGGARRLFAEVDESVLAVGEMDGGEAAAADIAAAGMHHRQRVAHRHRRVDGVAAGLQDIGAHLAGIMLGTYRHAVLGLDRGRRVGGRRDAGEIGVGKRGRREEMSSRQTEPITGAWCDCPFNKRSPYQRKRAARFRAAPIF